MIKKGWYERDETLRITRDWTALNCKNVTERELDLLRIVYERKLVRRDHLEIIVPAYRVLSKNSRVKVLNNSISKLFRMMCLDKMHEKAKIGNGNKPCIVAIDRAGSILLDVPHKRRIQHDKKILKGGEYIFRALPPNYKHIHGINQLEVDTILFCEENGCEMKWIHEQHNQYTFFYNQQKITFIPDVLFGIKINNKVIHSYIEFDTGKEDLRCKTNFPTLTEKLQKYRKFKYSNMWKEKFKRFPILLFVTEDEKRCKFVESKMKELGLQGIVCLSDEYRTKVLEYFKELAEG
ncbi:replication-relaxation family protein [Bacillus thuringiensis]|nr:replication-relaxation family protein [Bacillus cereus]MED2684000.1 replication-relaxation family protein [Bacillus thuringiensis]HDX9563586.1 replication-relaxation family protein [Bacillus thuringiensis]HDX9701739.1 replication-relaxation family protein [Bacillus thuringiensis]